RRLRAAWTAAWRPRAARAQRRRLQREAVWEAPATALAARVVQRRTWQAWRDAVQAKRDLQWRAVRQAGLRQRLQDLLASGSRFQTALQTMTLGNVLPAEAAAPAE
ncbi:hypothetical protein CXG81DRAFT_28630, partial [Caulochytrium protostelioides]